MNDPQRLFTVGSPVLVWRPADARRLVSSAAAVERYLELSRTEPRRVACVVRRSPPTSDEVWIFGPDGMLITQHTGIVGARLHNRLRSLVRDCAHHELRLGVPSWSVETHVLAELASVRAKQRRNQGK